MKFEEFIEKMVELHDFGALSHCIRDVPPHIIHKWGYCFHWGAICEMEKLTEWELNEYSQFFDKDAWTNACHYQKMSEEFMYRHYANLDWEMVCSYQLMSEQFMEISISQLVWPLVSRYQNLSEQFLERHKDKVYWEYLPLNIYDERWVIEHVHLIGWTKLPIKKPFSEDIIREYYDIMDWGVLGQYQKMSEDFVREFENDLTFGDVLLNSQCNLSANFMARYAKKIGANYWINCKDRIEAKYGKDFWNKYAILK